MASEQNGHDKRLSVERIYQKKTQLEHILLRPDTYIGSVEPLTQKMWVYQTEEDEMVYRDVTFVPGLYKIFDEIIVNAADHKQRDGKMDTIKVDIDPEENMISIYNNGKGIDVAMHKIEKVFVPTLIFGHLLTGANFDDTEKKVVGGRNGFGAKLCNIFSNKFIIETSSKKDNKYFKQTWKNNMSTAGEPVIKDAAKEDFTRVTFYPDLSKFGMSRLDQDTVALFKRRAYDIAGSTKGVKVYLNGSRLQIKGFKDYVDKYLKGKEDEMGNPLKSAFEACSDRWEIAVCLSDSSDFKQISFVNSIATTKGGQHVEHVVKQILDKLIEAVKKKNKAGIQVKPAQVRNHLWVFVNCLIENPAFDSQTKENLNTQVNKFGSKCTPSEKFFTASLKTGIVESVLNFIKFKADSLKDKQSAKTKCSKLKGIPKLEDANDAGTKNSSDCTLIVCEGDSAKSLVVAGLGVIGRDKYGVFPLKGKPLNVREASSKQVADNAEISNLVKIMGLNYKKQYKTIEDLKSLRYGKLMIMTDQDQDGSHIKGLLINFIHNSWESLLKLPFLEEFITPIVKVSKGSTTHSFYSLPEFDEWKKSTHDWNKWKVKYYKGLGTSTSVEAKEYFSNLGRHRIRFRYEGSEDDNAIVLAFSKKMADNRKQWLDSSMQSRKMRRELGLPEVYLYGKETKAVSYQDFVNKELVLFSNLDNERSIPSCMDGLKPGQRKVMFTCFKRNDKKEVKVAQLAGSVGEHSAYHHGEASLMQTIIGLAQNFVGSNNINLLEPRGQFGTRLQGGKDHASPRYIFTLLSPLARRIFHPDDDPLFNYLYDDNLRVEPEYYVPILPMVLVNGASGIGTGYSTQIPNYNPREIVRNLRKMMDYDRPSVMRPWFKGFRGQIDQVETSRFIVSGEISELDGNKLEVTELPIRTWTQSYKESVMETMLTGTEKNPQFIKDYKEYHTDTTVRFVISLEESKLRKAESEGLHKTFKLQTTFTTTSMVLFDSKGCLRKYDNAEEILEEFFKIRLDYYDKRKTYMLGKLDAECQKLKNQARFIQEKVDGDIKIENKKRKVFMATLEDRGYDSDPVKKWKIENGFLEDKTKKATEEDNDADSQVGSEDEGDKYEKDYDYLMDMPMKSMLLEKKEELLKKRDAKIAEHKKLEETSIQDLWRKDLDDFETELIRLEEKEKSEQESGRHFKTHAVASKKGGRNKGNLSQIAEDAMPSRDAIRVPPKIDFAAYAKNEEKAKAKKEGKTLKKTPKKKGEDGEDSETEDESIDYKKFNAKRKSVSDSDEDNDATIIEEGSPKKPNKKTKTSQDKKPAKEKKVPASKAASKTINDYFKPTDKKRKKDSSSEDNDSFIGDDSGSDWESSGKKKKGQKKSKKPAPIKTLAAKKDFKTTTTTLSSDSEPEVLPAKSRKDASTESSAKPSVGGSEDELTSDLTILANKPLPEGNGHSKKLHDSDDDDIVNKKPARNVSDSDDDDFDFKSEAKKKTKTKKDSDSDSDFDFKKKSSKSKKLVEKKEVVSKPKEKKEKEPKPEKKKVEKKVKKSAFDSSSSEDEYVPLAQRITSPAAVHAGSTTGRVRKNVNYNFDSDSD